ncbi:MAG: colanic acid biosynthesis glycosyltransferase WcaL [Hyphomicrobiales bacterium]|nr:MAG: colanic acid biosynthesis glycosyltransferase WcaL [Hyphomicrobiales bacterium]
MNTAYILLWFPNPTETFIFREVENLRRQGLELRVYTLYGPWRRNLSREMSATSVPVHRLGARALFRMLGDVVHWYRRKPAMVRGLFREAWLRRWRGVEKTAENLWAFLAGFHLARRAEADGIGHLHAPWANGPATAAWVASRLTGTPFSFTARAWDIYPPDALINEKVREARFVRSETRANISHLMKLTGEPEDKFRLTHNGVPFQPHEDAALLMRDPVQLLSVGRLVRKKGFDQLLRALALLAGEGVRVELTIAGSGPLRRPLQRLARQLNIAGQVNFAGFVSYDEVGALFQRADLMVMPCVIAPSGDRDGIPTVIMEALMHRLPVISTDVSGIPELIEHEVTGLLVPEKDPEALAAAIKRLAGDRDFALEIASRGRERVRERFNPEINHRAIFELYRTIGPEG